MRLGEKKEGRKERKERKKGAKRKETLVQGEEEGVGRGWH